MEVFLEALDRDEHERNEFAAQACGGDEALESAVQRLLEVDRAETATALPDLSALRDVALEPGDEPIGESLGVYRVREKIGDGGMGSVYLAERADGRFEQTVAIKILRTAARSATRVEYFDAERRILARLEHPGIARLIDGGETASGLPYLVMEYVAGSPITDYCRANRLSIEERLGLFRQVCSAMDHAHRSLVIHRDIKPGNILVDDQGVPKLLDFGIARLLSTEPAPQSETGPAETRPARGFTPDYASPEQILGRGLTTTTDVYSLGVLLYELLTGLRPFQRRGLRPEADSDPGDAATELSAPPPAPSQAAPARANELRGDLDAIILKAMSFAPEDRYGSVAALADDLERYRAGQPVAALAASGATYRLRKFVRRNRAGVAAGALAAILAIAYLVTVLVQTGRLREERNVADQVTEFLIESYQRVDPSQSRGETLTAREVLDDAARRIGGELEGQPAVKSRLQKTLGEVYLNLGLFEPAEEMVDGARSLMRAAGELESLDYAEAALLEASLLERKNLFPEALERVDEAQRIFAGHGDPAAIARAQHLEAGVRYNQGERDLALTLDRGAWQLEKRTLGPDHLQTLDGAFAVSRRLAVLGYDEEAAQLQDDTLARLRAQGLESHPMTAELLRQIAVRERRAGRLDAADELFAESLTIQRRLYGDRHPSIARTLSSLGNLRANQRRFDEAVELFDQALAMGRSIFGENQTRAAMIRFNRGFLLQRMSRDVEAEADIREAIEIRESVLGEASRGSVTTSLFLLAHGEALLSLGRVDEAVEAATRSLDVWEAREQFDGRNGCLARVLLAEVAIRGGDLDHAESELTTCYPVLREASGVDPIEIERARSRLERVYRMTGRTAEAERLTAAAVGRR